MSKSGSQMKTLKKVLQYIGTYRFWMLASIVLAAVTVALTLYIPILVGRAIDFIVDWKNVDFENILKLLIEIGILAAVTAVLQWLMNTINNKVTYQVVRDVRNQAFTRIQKLPLKYLDAHSYGEIVSRVIADVRRTARNSRPHRAQKTRCLRQMERLTRISWSIFRYITIVRRSVVRMKAVFHIDWEIC